MRRYRIPKFKGIVSENYISSFGPKNKAFVHLLDKCPAPDFCSLGPPVFFITMAGFDCTLYRNHGF